MRLQISAVTSQDEHPPRLRRHFRRANPLARQLFRCPADRVFDVHGFFVVEITAASAVKAYALAVLARAFCTGAFLLRLNCAGGQSNSRLNARLNAGSDSYPTSEAICATLR